MATQFLTALNQATNRHDRLADQVDDALKQATLEVLATGKPPTVTVKIALRPYKNNVMGIGGSVSATLPKPDGASHDNLIFADHKGLLHLNSPQADAFDDGDIPDNLINMRNNLGA